MPFKSKAQMRACYAKKDPNWDCKEWSEETPNAKKLPEKNGQSRADVVSFYLKRADQKIPGGISSSKHRTLKLWARRTEEGDEALRKGIKVEMEHTDDSAVAKEIALDHLAEDKKYYDKLETIHKEANVNNFTEMTTMDATPKGDENHAPLTRNPYFSPMNPEPGADYENGYQYAQELGHDQLGQVNEIQIQSWASRPIPWREGLAEGARRLGMGRVADMLEAAGGNMEPKFSAYDPNAETKIIPRNQAKTERMTKTPDPRKVETVRMSQNRVPTQRMTKGAEAEPRPPRPRKVDIKRSVPGKVHTPKGTPVHSLQKMTWNPNDTRMTRVAEKDDKCLYKPKMVAQEPVTLDPKPAGVEKKAALGAGMRAGKSLGGLVGMAAPVLLGALGGDAIGGGVADLMEGGNAMAEDTLGASPIPSEAIDTVRYSGPVAGGLAGSLLSPVTGMMGSSLGGIAGGALGGASDVVKGVGKGVGKMLYRHPDGSPEMQGPTMQGMDGSPKMAKMVGVDPTKE